MWYLLTQCCPLTAYMWLLHNLFKLVVKLKQCKNHTSVKFAYNYYILMVLSNYTHRTVSTI